MTGLVLSHFFVEEENFKDKYLWIEKAILENLKLQERFHIVLCGHGIYPPPKIVGLVQEVYWNDSVQTEEIGRGHPKFCIEGFKRCINAGCEFTLKNRAYDYIENDTLLKKNDLIVTEQSSRDDCIIGDLLMYGETSYLLDWWTKNPWDYSVNGRTNLYRNAPENFYRKAVFVEPTNIGWKTYENDFNDYWGKDKGHIWYGGKGFLKSNV